MQTSRFSKIIAALLVATPMLPVSGCSSQGIRFEAQFDDAEVALLRPGKGDPVKLGQTPFILQPQLLADAGPNGAVIRIHKEGYKSETIVLPTITAQTMGIIRVELMRETNACTQVMDNINEITRHMGQVVKLTTRRKYSEAETTAIELITKYPELALGYDLLGNAYYLNRKLQPALDAYKKSIALNPRNVETQRMVEKLSAATGRGKD